VTEHKRLKTTALPPLLQLPMNKPTKQLLRRFRNLIRLYQHLNPFFRRLRPEMSQMSTSKRVFSALVVFMLLRLLELLARSRQLLSFLSRPQLRLLTKDQNIICTKMSRRKNRLRFQSMHRLSHLAFRLKLRRTGELCPQAPPTPEPEPDSALRLLPATGGSSQAIRRINICTESAFH